MTSTAPHPNPVPTLVTIADQLWQVRHAFVVNGLSVHTRMTIARLGNGDLWVHSPTPPLTALVTELHALGPVTTVVAPNCAHHLFAKEFVAQFPTARLHLAPDSPASGPTSMASLYHPNRGSGSRTLTTTSLVACPLSTRQSGSTTPAIR